MVTQPDLPGHRGKPAPRPVADAARELGREILQPLKIRDPQAVEQLLGLRADVLVVAAYGQIVPVKLLDGVRFGGVNVHASLLPRWRGAAPIAAAILHGEANTGVSIMQMEAGLDTGPVFVACEVPIAVDATTPSLSAELAEVGAELLGAFLDQLAAGTQPHAVPQDQSLVTVAAQLTRADGHIDWSRQSAIEIERMIRALQPWPGVTAAVGGQDIRLCDATVLSGDGEGHAAGEIVARRGEAIDVACATGVLRVTQVTPPNSRQMTAAAYLRGRRI